MGRRVDMKWEDEKKITLTAFLRWPNKKGGISFRIDPTRVDLLTKDDCCRCPFNNYICNLGNILCRLFWVLPGDNEFEGKEKCIRFQPYGKIRYGKEGKH